MSFNGLGLNTHMGETVDVEIWRTEKDSWGDKKAMKVDTIESVPLAARTTTMMSNDAIRERVASGYTMYLDNESVAKLRASDEIRWKMPSGNYVVYALDGFREGLMWNINPLSTFDMGNEVNLKFVGAAVQ